MCRILPISTDGADAGACRVVQTMSQDFTPACPIPIQQYPRILLAHGGGGKLTHHLIEKIFLAAFGNDKLHARHDSAALDLPGSRLAFTTDSYVVRPIFFPGGDIGSLAVHGTVNDLAMSGARPLYLSAGFVLEEGLPMEVLWRVVCSMGDAARRCGVKIVTGDTKVVDSGAGDGLFINTAGIGSISHPLDIAPSSVQAGDVVLLSGDLGRHGMAIMSVREGLEFETTIESDSASLAELVLQLIEAGIELHCLRDLTRGGLASALNEISEASKMDIVVEEKRIPVNDGVRAACEILGLDPLHVACEGRFVAFVPARDAERSLTMMRSHLGGVGAVAIGISQSSPAPLVLLKSPLGAARILHMPNGEQLPRIC
jgi:hydrogenase expression/formation protein HypE